MHMNMSDPNPDICGVCFEEYSVASTGAGASPNDRHFSTSCRHALCLRCAVHHVVVSNKTFCPFCRESRAFSDAFAQVFETNEKLASPELAFILYEAKCVREAAEATLRRTDMMLQVLLSSLATGTADDGAMVLTTNNVQFTLVFDHDGFRADATLLHIEDDDVMAPSV